MATFSVLKSRVSKRLGLDETASGTDDTLLGYELNDAVRQFLLDTRCNVNSGTMTLTAGQEDYNLDSDILAINDLYLTDSNSDTRRLDRVSPQEILEKRRASSSEDSPYVYALNGNDLLMVYPTPAAADTINIYYVPKPTEMSSASHDPSNETYGGIPVEYHPALIEYAAWKMADYDDDQSSAQGQRYRDLYEDWVKKCRRYMLHKGGRRLPRVQVGRRRYQRTHPSQDIW